MPWLMVREMLDGPSTGLGKGGDRSGGRGFGRLRAWCYIATVSFGEILCLRTTANCHEPQNFVKQICSVYIVEVVCSWPKADRPQ